MHWTIRCSTFCFLCTQTLTYAVTRLAVYFWRIIGHPVPNRVYGPNNPLGNECHFEIVGSEIISLPLLKKWSKTHTFIGIF